MCSSEGITRYTNVSFFVIWKNEAGSYQHFGSQNHRMAEGEEDEF